MMKDETEMDDELRSEYDFRKLPVRRVGSGRKTFGGVNIRLKPDVAEMFPDSEAVNEALRFLIRITGEIDTANESQTLIEEQTIAQSLAALQDYQTNKTGIGHDLVKQWADSLGTDRELPCPQ
ncbi:hypothetical protein QUB75_16585 [Microcoleus sp. K1-B6]|uniref:hypothetical protein n=1 Tax=unclassified Microcoleus TaxID=2642155 RepID=UPI002FD4FCAB